MANFNQIPSGQTSVNLVLPILAFVASGTGTWNQPNYAWGGGNTINLVLPSLAFVVSGTGTWNQPNYAWGGGGTIGLTLGGGGTTTNLLTPAALLGANASVSTSGASGIWTLRDQLAAKRASAWP